VGFNGTNIYRGLAIFPLTSGGGSNAVIPADAEILDGWFLMKPVGSVPKTLSVHEITSNWNATLATWTKATSTTNWTAAGGDYKTAPIDAAGALRPSVNCTAPNSYCGWEEWSITDAVQKWVRDPASNRGLLIKQVDESQLGLAGFSSSNGTSNLPTLWVNYRAAPVGAYPADDFVSETLNDRMGLQVNVATGNLMVQANDLSIAGTGLDLAISRTFNSRSEGPSPNLGEDWMLDASLDVGLRVFPDGDAIFFGPSGYAAAFQRQADGNYKAPARLDATLVSDLASTGSLTMNDTGEVYRFQGGTLASHEDRYGNAITFTNSATPTLDTINDTQNRNVTATHDGAGRITQLTDSTSRSVAYRYDAGGRLDRFTDAAGNVTDYAYNGSGELVTITDPMGRETAITYTTSNGVRKVASFSQTLNLTGPVVAATSFAYSSDVSACPASAPDDPPAAGKTTVTGPTGVVTTYCWDAANRTTKVSDAALTTTSTWTDADTLDTITTPGGTTNNEYYAGDLLLKDRTDPTGAKTQFEYGAPTAPHDPTKVTDPQGVVTYYAYDADGNRCLVRHDRAPQGADLCADTTGAFAHLVYNANGTLATATDANGNTTTYSYDGSGRLTTTTPPSPLGTETRTYDGLSRPATVIDGKSQTTTSTYDALDRITLVTHQDGSQVSFTYDANGNRLTQTDAGGTVNYSYDRLNRLTSETPPSGPQVTYGYDLTDNLTSITDGGGTVSYQYAGTAGRLSSVTQPDTSQITFGYDADGNRNQVSYPNGVVLATMFDGASKKTSVTATKGAATLSSFTYGYDVGGLHTDRIQTETDMSGAITTYTYTSPGRLTRAQTKNSGGTVTEDYQYTYDPAGNRTSQDANGTQTTYSYNGANELTQAGSTTYSYDANGNLTGSSAGFGAAYNAKNQTSSVTPAGGSAVAMGYRGTGQTERTQAGVIGMGLSYQGVASTSDLSGDRYYTRDPDGELLAQRSASGTLYYLADARDSVTGLTDGTGALVASYRYDPFGNTTASTGVVSNRWRFTGEFFDADTGLYKIGARYYDPAVGRWTQQDLVVDPTDPAQSNRYLYVGGNPVNLFDPTGLRTWQDAKCVADFKAAHKGRAPTAECWRNDNIGLGPVGKYIVRNAPHIITAAAGVVVVGCAVPTFGTCAFVATGVGIGATYWGATRPTPKSLQPKKRR
jgi:RHS repeat-associated protein